MKVCPYSYFRWCGYFQGPSVSFVMTDEFSVRVTKITFLFSTYYYLNELWPYYQKDNFEPHNSLKLSFTNIQHLPSDFCWMWIFPWIKLSWHSCSLWDKLGWLNWFWQFLWAGLSSFNPKRFYYSYVWSFSLCERRTSFCTDLISRKLCEFLLLFSTSFTSLSALLLLPLSITLFVVMQSFWFYFI